EVAEKAFARMRAFCEGIAAAQGASVDVVIDVNYPVTYNHVDDTEFAVSVEQGIAGERNAMTHVAPVMGGEDFSYMLEARPGAFIFMGNGSTASLHNPAYDFNDEAIPHGVSYWVKLAESSLAA